MRQKFSMLFVSFFVAAALVLSSGCDMFKNGSPSSPTPEPTSRRTFTIVSGETFQPVKGARVTFSSVGSFESDSEGKVFLENNLERDRVTVEAEGFLKREFNLFAGTKDEITLWPDRPGFEAIFTEELLYGRGDGQGKKILRPLGSRLVVVLIEELLQEPKTLEAHRRAIHLLSDAFNGHTRPPERPLIIELAETSTRPDVHGLVLPASVDPNGRGWMTLGFMAGGGEITKAEMAYPSVSASTQIETVLRWLATACGLTPTSYKGIMNREKPTTSDFTDPEKLAMRLSLLRHPGNRFPDLGP